MWRLITGESLTGMLEEILEKNKSQVFSKEVIQAGFMRTGIWPFNASAIREKFADAYQWHQKSKAKTTEEKDLATMIDTIKETISPKTNKPKPRSGCFAAKNKLMLGSEMLEHAEKMEALAKKQQQEKNAAKEKKEQAKKDKQQAQKEKTAISSKKKQGQLQWQQARTCLTCLKIFRINHKFWTCEVCGVYKACILCQDDANIAKVHTAACIELADKMSSHESNVSHDSSQSG